MKQVQYLIIRSVDFSVQRRRISHEVWLVIALDEQLHPEFLSHGPFREIPAFWIYVRGGTLLWGKLCPVTLWRMPSLPSNEGPYMGYAALATLFFYTRPVREGFAERPGASPVGQMLVAEADPGPNLFTLLINVYKVGRVRMLGRARKIKVSVLCKPISCYSAFRRPILHLCSSGKTAFASPWRMSLSA